MFKLTCIVVIFIGATYLGYYFGESYKNRYKQLKEFHRLLLLLNNEVLYGSTPIPKAFQNIGKRSKSPFGEIFIKSGELLELGEVESVSEAIKKTFNENEDKIFLTNEDISVIEEFSKNLGETGVYGQDRIFNLAIENIKRNCTEAENLSKENIKMCRALGFTIGAMVALILI